MSIYFLVEFKIKILGSEEEKRETGQNMGRGNIQ